MKFLHFNISKSFTLLETSIFNYNRSFFKGKEKTVNVLIILVKLFLILRELL